MAFNDTQIKALKAKLSHKHVKSRVAHGITLAYIEGWHAIAEANRVFGFENWDRQTLSPECVWSDRQREETACFYTTKVRITVRADGTAAVREGIGTGHGRSAEPNEAHEIALKAAETDATKRALATFGNTFGLALYDREQARITKPRGRPSSKPELPVPKLRLADGEELQFEAAADFVAEILVQITTCKTVDAVYAFWSANLDALSELRRRGNLPDEGGADQIMAAFKERARNLRGSSHTAEQGSSPTKKSKFARR